MKSIEIYLFYTVVAVVVKTVQGVPIHWGTVFLPLLCFMFIACIHGALQIMTLKIKNMKKAKGSPKKRKQK